MSAALDRPGVEVRAFPPPAEVPFRTGVAGFVGHVGTPGTYLVTSLAEMVAVMPTTNDELLYNAVQGFFGNGGTRAWIVLYAPGASGDPLRALDLGVGTLAALDEVDLVCAPSLMAASNRIDLQRQLVRSCKALRDDWFLILDPLPPGDGADLPSQVSRLRGAWDEAGALRPFDAALYHPWVVPGGADFQPIANPSWTSVPPCGHIAGICARVDEESGPHRSPANQEVRGIVDVVGDPGDAPAEVNPLRPIPGRGICAWGARTLIAPPPQPPPPANVYVGVRRLMITLRRWLAQVLSWVAFEPNNFRLWVRVRRELGTRLTKLYLQGALQGRTPDEAFYVKCDDENNPDDERAAGKLHVDVGVAPSIPKEFITIQLVRSPDGVTVA